MKGITTQNTTQNIKKKEKKIFKKKSNRNILSLHRDKLKDGFDKVKVIENELKICKCQISCIELQISYARNEIQTQRTELRKMRNQRYALLDELKFAKKEFREEFNSFSEQICHQKYELTRIRSERDKLRKQLANKKF